VSKRKKKIGDKTATRNGEKKITSKNMKVQGGKLQLVLGSNGTARWETYKITKQAARLKKEVEMLS